EVNLGWPAEMTVVKVDEIVVLDAGSRRFVGQHIPGRLVQASRHDAPLRQPQLSCSIQQPNKVCITAHDRFESATLLFPLNQQSIHADMVVQVGSIVKLRGGTIPKR